MAIKTKAPKAGKVSLWNKIAVAMLDGEPVTPQQLKDFFKNDPKVSYFIPNRLSTIAWQLKTFEGAVIRVQKTGKKVDSYQLVNAKDFDKNGFGPLRQASAVVAKPVQAAVEPTEVVSVTEETAKVTE